MDDEPIIPMSDPVALLSHIEVPNQVRSVIMGGPGNSNNSYYAYLEAIDRLHGAVRFIEEELRNGRYLIAKAMENVKQDFSKLLTNSSLFPNLDELREAMLSEESPDHISPPEMVEAAAIPKLHAMAQRLIDNDCAPDCCKMYREMREAALKRNFQRLGVQQVTKAEIQSTPWPRLEEKMRRWSEHMHIGMILVAGEREACDQVFAGLEKHGEQCFVDLSRSCIILLTHFGDAISVIKKSPERLFSFLDMYETTLDLKSTVDELYRAEEGRAVRENYQELLTILGRAARDTFEKFEDAVKAQPTAEDMSGMGGMGGMASMGQPGNVPRAEMLRNGGFLNKLKKMMLKADDNMSEVGGQQDVAASNASGDVHPITSYVVNYLLLLCNSDLPYFSILECVFEDMANTANEAGSSIITPRVQGRLAFAAARILEALKVNLQHRALMLRDDALGELFLMNNLAYVLTKIDAADAGRLLGTAWIGNYGAIVDSHRDRFINSSLAKFDPVWSDDRLDTASLVKRLKLFNYTVEQMKQRYMAWTIPNRELRAHVKKMTLKRLLDKYRDFIVRHRNVIQSHRTLDVRVFTCEEIEQMLLPCFDTGPSRVK
ncbi:unnamed protein product [Closterium sp. Yama58-4]|nr:unnamed protein product [Closterium sp. Yama58-4]